MRAIRALAAVDAAPFTLIFGGGTALARAHRLVRRMSEDVDFKIVPAPAAPVSRSILRQRLGALRARVTEALQAAGFAFDPADPAHTRSRNENHYTVWQLPYDSASGAGEGLRPTIQVELTYAPMRRSPVTLAVASFVAEAMSLPPEVPAIPCVGVIETAAEKLVSLTRRTAMDLAGASRDPDPALVRHIYDLHMMREHLDRPPSPRSRATSRRPTPRNFATSTRPTTPTSPARPRKALDALRTDPVHRAATTASSRPWSMASGRNSRRRWRRSSNWRKPPVR